MWRISWYLSEGVSESYLTLPYKTPVSCTLECELVQEIMRGISGLNFSVVQLLFQSRRMRGGALGLFLGPLPSWDSVDFAVVYCRDAGSSERVLGRKWSVVATFPR